MSLVTLTVKSIEHDISNLYSDEDILRILDNEFPSPPQQQHQQHENKYPTIHDKIASSGREAMVCDENHGCLATATTTTKSSPPLYPTIDDIELAMPDIDCDQLLLSSRVTQPTTRTSSNNNIHDDDDDDSLTAFLLGPDFNDDNDEDSIDVLLRAVNVNDDDSLDALLLGGATKGDAGVVPREITFPAAAYCENNHNMSAASTQATASAQATKTTATAKDENNSSNNSSNNGNIYASMSNDIDSNINGTSSNSSHSNGSITINNNGSNSTRRKRNRDSEPTGIRKPPQELREQRNRRKLVRRFICLTNDEATVTPADETTVTTADETASVSSTVSSSSGDSVVDSMWTDDDEDVQDITSKLSSVVLFDDVAHTDDEADQNITALSSSIHYGPWSINRQFVYWQISSSSTRFCSSC